MKVTKKMSAVSSAREDYPGKLLDSALRYAKRKHLLGISVCMTVVCAPAFVVSQLTQGSPSILIALFALGTAIGVFGAMFHSDAMNGVDGKELQQSLEKFVKHFGVEVLTDRPDLALGHIRSAMRTQANRVMNAQAFSDCSAAEAAENERKLRRTFSDMYDAAKTFFKIPSYEWFFEDDGSLVRIARPKRCIVT